MIDFLNTLKCLKVSLFKYVVQITLWTSLLKCIWPKSFL